MKSHLQNLIKVNGAISIGQFMNEALFHPKIGYYTNQNPFGCEGDFITAPEISQVFGELIGAYLINLWQTKYSGQKINLVEMGAGKGTLMKDLLNFAKKNPQFSNYFQINIIEISHKLQEVQKMNLESAEIYWWNDFESFFNENSNHPIFFISNELFDCFAIDQFVKTNDGWAEKMVGLDKNNDLQFVLSKIPNLNVECEVGGVVERSAAAVSFMNQLSKAIKQTGGIALIIDYGYIKTEFRNTLQAVKKHQYVDVLKEVGSCDITALVDFSVLQNIAIKNQLHNSLITQKEFLVSIGIEIRREKLLIGKTDQEQENINSAIDRLIDEKQMGNLFKVLLVWYW